MVDDTGELRPAYRTLDEPVRFLGIALAGWAGLLAAAGVGYGWLLLSPLGTRASISVAVIVLGAPACLLVLREQTTVGPARLLTGVLRWRAHAQLHHAPPQPGGVRRGGVRLASEPERAARGRGRS